MNMIPDTTRSHFGVCAYDQFWLAFVTAITITCFCDRDFDITLLFTFALICVSSQTLRDSPEFTFGFWSQDVTAWYNFHVSLRWVNLIFIGLALYACKAGAEIVRPHMSTWTLPKCEDMSFGSKLKGGTVFFAFTVLFALLLASWPALSSTGFIAFVLLYVTGFCKLLIDLAEDVKTKTAAASTASAASAAVGRAPKNSVSISNSTRVNDFWRIHMVAKGLTEGKQLSDFTKECSGNNAAERNKKILFLFKSKLIAANFAVHSSLTP